MALWQGGGAIASLLVGTNSARDVVPLVEQSGEHLPS